jgi:hypothetical protein
MNGDMRIEKEILYKISWEIQMLMYFPAKSYL